MTRSGLSATMRSRSTPAEVPTRGTRATSGGQSAGARTPTTRSPAPAANRSSVACGARLTMRAAGTASSTRAPVASTAATGAAPAGPPRPAMSATNASQKCARSTALKPVTDAREHARARSVVVGHELVMLVERVVQTCEERPAAGQRIVRRQIDERITAHVSGARRVVESLGRSDDLGAQPQPLPGLPDRNRAVAPRAPREQIARCVVLGALQIGAGSDAQAAPRALEFDRNALQRRVLDVLRRTGGGAAFEHDQIPDTVVIRDDSHGETASRIAQRRLEVARRLRLEAGI